MIDMPIDTKDCEYGFGKSSGPRLLELPAYFANGVGVQTEVAR